MEKIVIIFFLCIFIFSNISALCEENQININSASKNELENLHGIGPVKAEAIINSRPFESVDDLIKVYGIGEITLEKIKEQGLACVEEETEEIVAEEKREIYEKVEEKESEKEKKPEIIKEKLIDKKENIELKTINLNAQTIKSEDNINNSNKSNYAMYGFVGFCVLLGFLFILKKQRNYKTEF
ncbi:helix-hairpin-helix domain-containing protein [Candidatus Pacearchaeota archaeon]|nr:helix-hairpin-helix domain-containing protein [Candidatus Pacearchaeota archaeon]